MGTAEKKIRRLSRKLHNKKIYAMGSQNNIQYVQELLDQWDLHIEAILDNNEKKCGDMKGEFDTWLPETKLRPYDEEAVILIYSPGYWVAMRQQLEDMGYREGRQVFVINPKIKNQSVTLQVIQGMKQILEGEKIYRRLRKHCGDNFEIIVLRGATGDVYLNGIFLADYLERNRIRDYIITGDSKGLRKIMQFFPVRQERVIPLNQEETTSLLRFGIFKGYEETHIKNVFLWRRSLKFNRCRIRLSDRFNFMDTYRYLIYHTSEDFCGITPRFESSVDIRQLLKEKGLPEGKTVVISPIAYSVENMPLWFWKKLDEELKKRGYTTCANLSPGREEGMYDFFTPVFVPFDASVELLERCGYFIALRSGFCDIVSSARCKKIVLYPSDKRKVDDAVHRCDLLFSGLNNMGLCNDAIEYESPAINDVLLPEDYINEVNVEEELLKLIDDILQNF